MLAVAEAVAADRRWLPRRYQEVFGCRVRVKLRAGRAIVAVAGGGVAGRASSVDACIYNASMAPPRLVDAMCLKFALADDVVVIAGPMRCCGDGRMAWAWVCNRAVRDEIVRGCLTSRLRRWGGLFPADLVPPGACHGLSALTSPITS